jgi:hypothetical protein
MGATSFKMNSTEATIRDQASGLRELFHAHTLPAHLLTCPTRPALVLPLAQMLCHALARHHVVAWMDEMDLNAREQWPLPASLRFDLGQALEGHVDLAQAMHTIQPGLFYALSCKTRKIKSCERDLQQRLMSSGVAFDALVVAAHPDSNVLRYSSCVHHLVVSGADSTSLEHTLQWMLKVKQTPTTQATWGMVMLGDQASMGAARHWLQQHAEPLLAQSIPVVAAAPAHTLSAALSQAWEGQTELMASLKQQVLDR